MGDFYIIGENRKIAAVNDASTTCAVTVDGTTYVYWRDASTTEPRILVSTSTDGIAWTAPAVSYAEAGYDVHPAGVVHIGSQFVLAVASVNIANGTVITRLLGSVPGIAYSGTTVVSWTEYWAFPTDLEYVDGTYYLAASIRLGSVGPLVSSVKTSTNLTAWTSLGYASQLTPTQNVWPRITVKNGIIDLVHREGDFAIQAVTDQILHTRWAYGSWGVVDVAVPGGTGNPDIAPLSVGYAVIYKDQSVQGGHGIWSWAYYDGDTYAKRGAFSQNFEYGTGGSVITASDGFNAIYATRTSDASTAGTLFSRHFTDTFDSPPTSFVPSGVEDRVVTDANQLENFSFEVSFGSVWASLSDGLKFFIGPDDFGSHAQVLRRITAQSPFYEGTYLIHAVRENVQEQFAVNVLGVSQNDVTENLLLLEEIVSQPVFKIRLTMGDHVETWSCQQADYTIERGHINMHNTRAVMRVAVPRLPEVTYEVT